MKIQDQDTFYKKNCIFFIVILGSLNLTASAQTVNFPDANLAAAIRTRLELPEGADIPQTSLAAITSLSVQRKGIINLTGLEHATGLTFLQLVGNPIRDFTPISSLTNLTNLNLANTGFSDSDISILAPMDIEAFTWDRVVLSDWLLPASEETDVRSPNAPSASQRKLPTTWGHLKTR